MIALWCQAVVSTAVNGGLAASVALSAVRIWRRRNQAWVSAVRVGGYWRAVAGFALASAGLRVVRVSITPSWSTQRRKVDLGGQGGDPPPRGNELGDGVEPAIHARTVVISNRPVVGGLDHAICG
jgi:hypothetical protein